MLFTLRAASMFLPQKKARVVREAVEQLLQEQVIDATTAARINGSIQPLPFDWRRLARYSFITALVCAIISVGTMLADDFILDFLLQLFNSPPAVKSAGLAIISAWVFSLGFRRKKRHPDKIFSNEMVFFAGVLGLAGSIAWLGQALDTGSGHFSLLLMLGAMVYAGLGLMLNSKLTWVFGLLSLGSWFGAETGYMSGWGAYYLGMSFPLRFVLFGLALTLSTSLMRNRPRLLAFHRPSLAIGLLYLFIALWILSIWGNYEGYDDWHRASHWELLHWSLYFGAAAVISIYLGLKHDDGLLRGFGLTFFFINLYTRFFEFFWNGTHKGVFFALLALSFWVLGSRAESLWQMNLLKRRLRPPADVAPD